jgi:hypothetical protein
MKNPNFVAGKNSRSFKIRKFACSRVKWETYPRPERRAFFTRRCWTAGVK